MGGSSLSAKTRAAWKLFVLAEDGSSLTAAVDAIGAAIEDMGSRIPMSEDIDPDFEEFLREESCAVVESLYGAAFLLCQERITQVVARALLVRKHAVAQGVTCSTIPAEDWKVRDMSSPLPSQSHSAVQLVWALGNYFKHREQWDKRDWSKLSGLPRRTTQVLQPFGLSQGSNANLENGAQALGVRSGRDLPLLATAISGWYLLVEAALKSDLGI